MPHDKNGRLIERGDTIKVKPLNHPETPLIVGTVMVITPGAQSCSGQVSFPVLGGMEKDYFNASDAELVLKANGTEPQ